MKIVVKYYSRKFKDENAKEAYLKATKWFAKNVLTDKVLKDSYSKIERLNDEDGLKVYKLDLYADIDEAESRESFCKACKEFHTKFYINQQFNCDRCNMIARTEQIKTKLLIKKEYRRETLKHSIGRNAD